MFSPLSLVRLPVAHADAAPAAAAVPKKDAPKGLGLYLRYGLGGALCCGLTHWAVVPIDVVKTRLQLFPGRYAGMGDGFKKIIAEEGAGALLTGAMPTFVGYCMQGFWKFGLYEFNKATLYNWLGNDVAVDNRRLIFSGSSAAAECVADLFLCPMEAARIKLVSDPTFAKSMPEAFNKIIAAEGFGSLYAGLAPILLKQVPYTILKFLGFEMTVEAIYKALPVPKEKLSNGQQLGISLGAGVIAGAMAAVVSHPADTMLSKVNKIKTKESVGVKLSKAYAETGFKGLWLGLGARIAMVATLTGAQFFVYDSVKVLFGIPPTAPWTKTKKV